MGPLLLGLMLAGQASEPAVKPQAAKPQLVCRESEQETGSHIRSGRRCKTAEEWAHEDQKRVQVPPSMRVTDGQGDALTKSPSH
jgi:hypothetical protein